MRTEDSVVLVTGGANGIGEAVGRRFLNEGAEVVVLDVEEPEYEARYFEADVRDEDDVADAFGALEALDALVNNAGVYRRTPLDAFDASAFDEIYGTNVKGYRLVFTHALPLLRESDDGVVVNVSSALSRRPEPESDLYSASKAAVNAMKTSWANSYAETGVRANAFLPGPVLTDMLRDASDDEGLDEYREEQPRRAFAEPEDVADAVVTLVSNEAYNGAEWEVGGEADYNQYGL